MKRRTVVRGLTTLAAAGLVSAIAARSWFFPAGNIRLALRLKHLVHKDFAQKAEEANLGLLQTELMEKGVLSMSGDINAERLRDLSSSEELTSVGGWDYSETEAQLYTFAYLLSGRLQK